MKLNKIKKMVSLLLAAALAVLCASGCSGGEDENEQNTLTINLGIKNVEQLIEGLEKKFPDINFVITPTYCANQSGYLRQTLVTGNASDIFYYSQSVIGSEAAEFLLDLSGYDFISNFDRSIINTFLVDGRIYTIPGPVALRGMAYNKTLFEQHGWKKPENHRELVALCRQIREETDDITPISMSAGGVGYPFTLVTTLSQAGFLGTPAGEEWEKRFLAGEASVAEGWGEGLKMTSELIDAGAFDIKDYIGVWDADACRMDFANGKAAMFAMWAGQAELLDMIENHPEYEYAFMPFYGINDGEVAICANPNLTWGISKRLAEKGNEKKLENALRVMEWFSTAEAQDLMKSYVTDSSGSEVPTSTEMSPLNIIDGDKYTSHYFQELWTMADKGNKLPMIYSGYESVIVNAGTIVQNAMLSGSSEGMTEAFTASADKDYKDHLAGGQDAVLCEITQDMTEEQTAQLLANGLNEAGLGDFTLVTHTGRAERGIYNKFGAGAKYFKGKLTNQDFNVILADSKNIQTLNLTGAQVKKLLEEGKRVYNSDKSKYTDFPYYWAGIDVKFDDGKVSSARLNGSELEDGKVYTVVFCFGDYTDELAQSAPPADTGIQIPTLWLEYVSRKKQLSPPEVLRK